MTNSKETLLINQLAVYANSFFKWDGRAEYVLKADERLSTYPVKKRESVLDKLIHEQDVIASAQPDHDSFSSYERTTTLEKLIRAKVKKIGYEAIDREFGNKIAMLERFNSLAGTIKDHMEVCDRRLQKYYDEENHLSKTEFSPISWSEIINVFGEFSSQMLKDIKDWEEEYRDIQSYVTEGSENLFDVIKMSLKSSTSEINVALTNPHIDKLETKKGTRYINSKNILIHRIKHNNSDILEILHRRSAAYKHALDKNMLTKLWGLDEIERIERLIIAIDKRDALLKKAGQAITSSAAQNMIDIISPNESNNDHRIPIESVKRKNLIEDFARLVNHKILTIEDTKYWLCADFQGFKNVDDSGLPLNPKMKNKDTLKYFIYRIYKIYGRGDIDIDLYRKMLINRIYDFKHLTSKQIRANFSKKPPDLPPGLDF